MFFLMGYMLSIIQVCLRERFVVMKYIFNLGFDVRMMYNIMSHLYAVLMSDEAGGKQKLLAVRWTCTSFFTNKDFMDSICDDTHGKQKFVYFGYMCDFCVYNRGRVLNYNR